MSDVTIPGGRIRSFVERIENIDTELQELNEQKKEVFAEAKGEGFDVKILREIIKLRKQDQDERDERESLLDLYMRAMETAPPEKTAKAAWVDRHFPECDSLLDVAGLVPAIHVFSASSRKNVMPGTSSAKTRFALLPGMTMPMERA
jgi:uncharacterized protein (UPF0335 family)